MDFLTIGPANLTEKRIKVFVFIEKGKVKLKLDENVPLHLCDACNVLFNIFYPANGNCLSLYLYVILMNCS